MRTETVSFLKQNAAKLDLDEPMCITQNGKPLYMIESYEHSQRREEAVSLLKIASMARKDIENGRVKPMSSLRASLASRKQLANSETINESDE